jgi:hypothetical protein
MAADEHEEKREQDDRVPHGEGWRRARNEADATRAQRSQAARIE